MLLNNKHYYNLPPQERKDLWKHYKKLYPNMGYTDMVKHFNSEVENYQFGGRTDYFDSDVKKFADGGTDKPKVETVKSKFEMGGVLDGLDNNIKQEASTTSVKINKIPKELIMFPDKYTTDMGSFYKDYSKYLQNKYNVSIDHNSTTASALNIFAYFNPVTDEINYKDKFKRDVNHRATGDVPILIKEIPHKIQKDKYGTASFIYNIAKDLIKYPKNIEKFMKPDNQGGGKLKDLGVYKNPGTLEHEAHSIIEPKLRNDFKYRYDEIKKFNKKQNSGLIKKYEDGGTDKPKVNSKILSGLANNIPKNRLEAESREEYKRMHPEIEAANFYNKIQKNINQTSEIYQSGPKKGQPTGKGALEPSYPEMMLMPGSLPIKAASKLGKAAVFAAEALNPIGGVKNLKNTAKELPGSGNVGNYQNILDKGLDIHDVRLKYHNNMILDFDEADMISKFGKGNKTNYERALVEDIAGKMHTNDVSPKIEDISKKNILDHFIGTEQPKVAIPDKSVKPLQTDKSINPVNFEQKQNIIKPPKFELPSFYSAPYQRTSTSRAADKWLEDWFYNPQTKQKFINYGGTEGEWSEVLNSLENPIKSNYTWGKNQPGGVYIKPFDQASIPLNATVDKGVHEGIHKAKLLLDKNNPVLHRLWNDFTDAVRLTPSEAYPEIFRFRQKLGLKPGQTIDLKTMEDNLHLISDGYSLPYKIKDKNKLLEIINKAPAVIPPAVIIGAGALQQDKKTK